MMTTYTASADASGIKLNKTGLAAPETLAWRSFQNQMTSAPLIGGNPRTNFTRSQTEFNYFDSIKDGTAGGLQNSLGIYLPYSRDNHHVPLPPHDKPKWRDDKWNPTGSIIKNMRNKFTNWWYSNIEPETWLKLKNSNNHLDPKKIYDFHFWDAGMTAERILKSTGGGESIELASIGTLIDPASGKTEGKIMNDVRAGTKQLFPRANNAIRFNSSFMNAIGFSGNTYIDATSQTVSGSGGGGAVPFHYTMNVGCGHGCTGPNNCLITNTGSGGGPSLAHYTIGNNAKNAVTKGSGNADEKTKFIVLKEWGDKMQVMCHLMRYHLDGAQGGTTTLLTNDFPVFCLCLNFQIPCIFTGQTEKKGSDGFYKPILPDFKRTIDPGDEGNKEKAYGILTFVPGDPRETLYRKILRIRDEIDRENELFFRGITQIQADNRAIKLGGSNVTLRPEYWRIMLADITEIRKRNRATFGARDVSPAGDNFGGGWWRNGVCPALEYDQVFQTAYANNVQVNDLGDAVDAFIERMKTEAYIKRVVKNVKYTANGSGRNRGTNSLKLMRFNTYTGHLKASQGGYTFGFSQGQLQTRNFSERAMGMREAVVQGGGAKMKGGANGAGGGESKGPPPQIPLPSMGPPSPPPRGVSADDWWWVVYFPGDWSRPVLYYEGEDDEPGSAASRSLRVNAHDLTRELFTNLILPLYTRFTPYQIKNWNTDDNFLKPRIDYYNGIVATIYSQYCYESWIDGQAATEFSDHKDTIERLLINCDLNVGLITDMKNIIFKGFQKLKLKINQRRLGRYLTEKERLKRFQQTFEEKHGMLRREERRRRKRKQKREAAMNKSRGILGRQLLLSATARGGRKTRKKRRRRRKKTRRRRRKKDKRKTRKKR